LGLLSKSFFFTQSEGEVWAPSHEAKNQCNFPISFSLHENRAATGSLIARLGELTSPELNLRVPGVDKLQGLKVQVLLNFTGK